MAEDTPIRLDTRLAGQLRRYHTWPIIGEQTIAEHTWNVMRIYMSVCEDIDPKVVYYIQFHDIGENAVGDLPFPVKRDNQSLKEVVDNIEDISRVMQLEYWDAFREVFLGEENKTLCKSIELIEMAEFGLDQMNLGNHHGCIIADRCLHSVYDRSPPPRLARYVARRLLLFEEQYTFSIPQMDWWSAKKWGDIDVRR